ncbi:MAG TPA: YihY/virulence factor BrkB family protein [Burkholderiales bacterium]|nr:YihY/virulence factor BrkB family protein [Burkholderiales bacterium]
MRTGIKRYVALLRDAAASWSADYAPSMGAALSYYSLFSIAPLLLIVIGIAGLAFGEDAARGAIVVQLQDLIGRDSAKAVQALLEAADKPKQGILSTLIGVAVLLLGSTTVFAELQNDLDRIWRAPAREQASGWWQLLRTRLLSFGMILGIAFLLMVSLVLSTALAALGRWWSPAFGDWEALAHGVDIAVSFALITVVFALIYRFIPRVHVAWHDVWLGAAVTSLLFALGKFLIGLYLGRSAIASTFGAAGSLVVLLVWVYYSAQIFLFGAEFTWVYAHALGSRRTQAGTRGDGPPAAVSHRPYPAPRVQPAAPARERRSLISRVRRRHPYAGVGTAFALGAAAAVAQGRGGNLGFLSGIRRRWT